jgi:hypothetical protein
MGDGVALAEDTLYESLPHDEGKSARMGHGGLLLSTNGLDTISRAESPQSVNNLPEYNT